MVARIITILALFPLVLSMVAGGSSIACRDNERTALLRFKQGLIDPFSQLSSWSGPDCCKWAGIRCNNRTSHVTELRLQNPSTGDDGYLTSIGGEISPSLLELTHLRYLDLSGNDFDGASIPEFMGSLTRLRYLNLSDSRLGGIIPHQLGNLTNLRYLDLHWCNIPPRRPVADSLHWLSRLSSLRYLDLSAINLTEAGVFAAISKLPALSVARLSNCDLNSIPAISIPEFICSFTRLRYLNLSDSRLGGIIPHQLGNLTNLRYLDLHWRNIPPRRPVADSLHWLSRLSSLRYLDLSAINLTETGVFAAISKLPALSVARLSNCDLNSIPTSLPANFSRLSAMDLSKNGLSSVPRWLFGIKSLEAIDLSYNSLSGTISGFGNLSSLCVLRLRTNYFNLTIPETIGSLCNLQVLDLSYNGIDLDISKFQQGLSGCAMNSLQTLDLGGNLLTGDLPDRLGMFRNLSELRLDNNFLSGSIPGSVGRLSSLRYLYLANNKLEGSVPESIRELSELVVLDLGFNSLTGFISDAHLTNLTKLEALFLSSNSFALNMSSGWAPHFQLKNIHLDSCVLGPRFPSWLKTQRTFSTIDISNGSIADSMPDWFWNLSSRVYYMNLSHNQISGSIPVSFTFSNIPIIDLRSNQFHGPLPHIDHGVDYLYLSDNSFSGNLLPVIGNGNISLWSLLLSDNLVNGTIPQSICGMSMLDVLDLSSNFLSGEIPNCSMVTGLWSAINLSDNDLSGQIPQRIGSLTYLESLHLSNNSLQGVIPSLENCTSLKILDLGENKLQGNIPAWIGESLSSLKMLRLRSNMLDGKIPHQLSLLSDLQVLDLAENNLVGAIPPWLGNLTAVTSTKQMLIDFYNPVHSGDRIDYEYIDLFAVYTESMLVALKGNELKYSKTLSLVVSLDLSGNGFSGEIPEELMELVGMQSLNLSGNHLTGKIPGNIAYLRQLETLDLSRNKLYGTIPSGISSLTFLSHLDLSYNSLSGRIPTGNQLQTLDPSIYAGNPDLCGIPLSNKCPGDEVPDVPVPYEAPRLSSRSHSVAFSH